MPVDEIGLQQSIAGQKICDLKIAAQPESGLVARGRSGEHQPGLRREASATQLQVGMLGEVGLQHAEVEILELEVQLRAQRLHAQLAPGAQAGLGYSDRSVDRQLASRCRGVAVDRHGDWRECGHDGGDRGAIFGLHHRFTQLRAGHADGPVGGLAAGGRGVNGCRTGCDAGRRFRNSCVR